MDRFKPRKEENRPQRRPTSKRKTRRSIPILVVEAAASPLSKFRNHAETVCSLLWESASRSRSRFRSRSRSRSRSPSYNIDPEEFHYYFILGNRPHEERNIWANLFFNFPVGKDAARSSWKSLTEAGPLFHELLAYSDAEKAWDLRPCPLPDDSATDQTLRALNELVTEIRQCPGCRITEAEVENFHSALQTAFLEFQLYALMVNLVEDQRRRKIQKDQPVDLQFRDLKGIIKTNLIHRAFFGRLMKNLIRAAKHLYMSHLSYQYGLFLVDSDVHEKIDLSGDLDKVVKKLIAEVGFKEEYSHYLSRFDLIEGLEHYIQHARAFPNGDMELKSSYQNKLYRKYLSEERAYEKNIRRFPTGFEGPFHFLAYKMMREGYDLQPEVVELTKIRAYFYLLRSERMYLSCLSQ